MKIFITYRKETLLFCECSDFFTGKGPGAEVSYSDQSLPLLICRGLVLKVTKTIYRLASNRAMDICALRGLCSSLIYTERFKANAFQLILCCKKPRGIHICSHGDISVVMLLQLLSISKNKLFNQLKRSTFHGKR